MTQFFKFQIFPLTPQYPCWIWPSFAAKSLKLCQQHWFGGKGVFSLKNRFSILSQQFCTRLQVIDILSQIAQWYWNACWCTVCFKIQSIRSYKSDFHELMLIFSIKIWYFGRLPSIFYQINHETLSLLSLKPTQMSL